MRIPFSFLFFLPNDLSCREKILRLRTQRVSHAKRAKRALNETWLEIDLSKSKSLSLKEM